MSLELPALKSLGELANMRPTIIVDQKVLAANNLLRANGTEVHP
jgi:hypothetical protein